MSLDGNRLSDMPLPMNARREIPKREWLAVTFPAACSVILVVAAFASAAGRRYGSIVVLSCFAAGVALPLSYTLVLIRDRRLYLRDRAEIERKRDRLGAGRAIGWIVAAGFLAVGVGMGGLSEVALLATLGGLAFGLWPGLLANFLRLRREHHWQ
jgi:hypothetical protein